MNNYPFTRCLKPRRILNPYTGESLVVACGVCPACSLRKSSVNALKCKLESLSHKYTMFVTLTYNNLSLPRMMWKPTNRYKDDCGEVCDTFEKTTWIDITQRLGTQGTILGRYDNWPMMEMLQKKTEQPFKILPHLSKYDAQLFIKRLRRNLDKYFIKNYGKKAPKIRYYLVGEYGPVHFRPHYHLELWFSDDETYKIIRQIIHQSWPFGRIDCQKSLHKSADYVAKYLNCSVPLPEVFKFQQTRPFSIHSAHLGEKILEKPREEIYQNDYERVIKRSIPSISSNSDVILWRSLKTYYFPKCKGYFAKSEHERLFSYQTYVNVYRWTKETRVSEQTRIILDLILRKNFHSDVSLHDYGNIRWDLIDYFEKSCMFPFIGEIDNDNFHVEIEKIYQRIYMELRISKHFHKFVCKGFVNLYVPMMAKIEKFWSDNDAYNLKHHLSDMEEFSVSEWFENENGFDFFYHNIGFDISKFINTKAFKTYESVTTSNLSNSVKHKRLNDLNKVFENK